MVYLKIKEVYVLKKFFIEYVEVFVKLDIDFGCILIVKYIIDM